MQFSPGCCSCGCVEDAIACVTVTDSCDSSEVSGATVTFSKSGETDVVGTSDGLGVACVMLGQPGTWDYSVAETGYTTGTGTITVSCGGTTSATKSLARAGGRIHVTFAGSCSPQGIVASFPIPGATVTAKQGTTTIATGTTDANGEVTINVPVSGTGHTVTASHPDYSTSTGTQTGVFVGTACTTANVSLVVPLDAHYHCANWRNAGFFGTGGTCLAGDQLLCATPWGDVTLTWNATDQIWIAPFEIPLCPDTPCETPVGGLIYYDGLGEWGLSYDCGETGTYGGTIPAGGDSRGGADTGGGSCSPFYSWVTITLHSPVPWANLMGVVFWCGSDFDSTYTFSVTEIPNP